MSMDPFAVDITTLTSMTADEQWEVLSLVEHHLDLAQQTWDALLTLHEQVFLVISVGQETASVAV